MTFKVKASLPLLAARLGRHAVPTLAGLVIAGCGSLGVQPWERELLAKPAMQLDASPVVTAIDEHIQFSKEAATGGRAFGGGGCGCH